MITSQALARLAAGRHLRGAGLVLTLLLGFARVSDPQELKHRSTAPPPTPNLPPSEDILFHAQLTPPLQGNTLLRFSPDGTRVLIQAGGSLFVVSRNPLSLLLAADVGEAYPAAFSGDSQSVSVLSHSLMLTTWQLSDPNHPVRLEARSTNGCVDAKLSPDAAWIVCWSPDFSLEIYRAGNLQRAFSQKVGPEHTAVDLFSIPLRRDSPFAGPFGFMPARDLASLAGRRGYRAPVHFSPDSKFLLFNDESASFRIDLPSLNKTNLPGFFHKHPRGILGISTGENALVRDSKKDPVFEMVSLAGGERIAPASFSADTANLASNPRYALLGSIGSPGVTLFDLQNDRPLPAAPNLAADVWGDEMAAVSPQAELLFYHLGQDQPVAGGRLPVVSFPLLRSALADSSLSTLALSMDGAAATFDLSNGKRLAGFKSFRGVAFAAPDVAVLATSVHGKPVTQVSYWSKNAAADLAKSDWTAEKTVDLLPSQKAFVAYSFSTASGSSRRSFLQFGLKDEFPYELRGLDIANGRELWKRIYSDDTPVPFTDPQGARIVLGWRADSDSARSVAKHFPSAHESFKSLKVKDLDSLFEVLDAATGVSSGAVLVQFGSGPASFESAFAVGDFLILTKDLFRHAIFRISDGKPLGRLRGGLVAVSEFAKMVVTDDGAGKLSFYNLETMAKIAVRPLPDYLSYLRFSETGDRLLVLTAHQQIIILDTKKTIEAYPVPATREDEHPSENP